MSYVRTYIPTIFFSNKISGLKYQRSSDYQKSLYVKNFQHIVNCYGHNFFWPVFFFIICFWAWRHNWEYRAYDNCRIYFIFIFSQLDRTSRTAEYRSKLKSPILPFARAMTIEIALAKGKLDRLTRYSVEK